MRCRIACDSIHPGIFDGEARPAYICIPSRSAKRIARTMAMATAAAAMAVVDGDKVMGGVLLGPCRFNPRQPTVINPARRGALLCDPTRARRPVPVGLAWLLLVIIRRAIPSMTEGEDFGPSRGSSKPDGGPASIFARAKVIIGCPALYDIVFLLHRVRPFITMVQVHGRRAETHPPSRPTPAGAEAYATWMRPSLNPHQQAFRDPRMVCTSWWCTTDHCQESGPSWRVCTYPYVCRM